jgi:branched-chain amino acid aminotransferase
MLHKFVCHNGRIAPLEEVRFSPGQAGLLNGWGVFTTMRIYDGRPFAFDRHWKRLAADAGRINLPLEQRPETTLQQLASLIQTNQLNQGCARIYFICNKVGYWKSDEPMADVDSLICTADLLERKGAARLAVREHGRHATSPLSGVKVTSWLQNVWALDQTVRRGFDEVLLLNERGEVAECTAANIFSVRDQRILTPPLSSGCLAGVTRSVLLESAGSLGLRIEEAPMMLPELLASEEVFLTSTTREVQPVSQIEAQHFQHAPGPVTRWLAEAFSRYVAESL